MNAGNLESHSITPINLAAGVDWLTMTVKQPEAKKELFQRFNKLRTVIKRLDAREKRFSWRGYVGLQVSGMRWGTRPDSDILILSGPTSAVYWKLFARLSDNVTRLDLAVTTLIYPPVPKLTTIYYENLEKGQRKWAEIRSSAGGNTLYVGRRVSDQMGRIYDKGIESGISPIAGAVWRYEIEYKGQHPKTILNKLLIEHCPRRGVGPLIAGHTFEWFDDRNIPPIFNRSGTGVIESHIKTVNGDDERTLMWFRTQVAPAIKQLISHRRTDVLDALGLEEADPSLYSPSI